jgi:hypothetical protein
VTILQCCGDFMMSAHTLSHPEIANQVILDLHSVNVPACVGGSTAIIIHGIQRPEPHDVYILIYHPSCNGNVLKFFYPDSRADINQIVPATSFSTRTASTSRRASNFFGLRKIHIPTHRNSSPRITLNRKQMAYGLNNH